MDTVMKFKYIPILTVDFLKFHLIKKKKTGDYLEKEMGSLLNKNLSGRRWNFHQF
jgi:hypothetical protein